MVAALLPAPSSVYSKTLDVIDTGTDGQFYTTTAEAAVHVSQLFQKVEHPVMMTYFRSGPPSSVSRRAVAHAQRTAGRRGHKEMAGHIAEIDDDVDMAVAVGRHKDAKAGDAGEQVPMHPVANRRNVKEGPRRVQAAATELATHRKTRVENERLRSFRTIAQEENLRLRVALQAAQEQVASVEALAAVGAQVLQEEETRNRRKVIKARAGGRDDAAVQRLGGKRLAVDVEADAMHMTRINALRRAVALQKQEDKKSKKKRGGRGRGRGRRS